MINLNSSDDENKYIFYLVLYLITLYHITAEPFIEKGFEGASEEIQLITVEVGDRPL